MIPHDAQKLNQIFLAAFCKTFRAVVFPVAAGHVRNRDNWSIPPDPSTWCLRFLITLVLPCGAKAISI